MKPARSQQNPFTASFGVPNDLTFVGRQRELSEFLEGLDEQPGSTHRAITVAGPRGVGKTSLLTVLADHARATGWITASVTAGPGAAERILDKAQLAAESLLDPEPRRRLTGISVAGFSLQSQAFPPDTPSWWRRINKLLDVLEENGSGLVIAVDEVHRDEQELRPLFQQYQELVNDRRNIAIIMAGLPDAVDGILTEYSLTFVQRAFHQTLGPIDLDLIKDAYLSAFAASGKSISPDAAETAAQLSEGHPYLYQLIGYYTWRAATNGSATMTDVAAALSPAKATAGRNLYGMEVIGLTPRERDFLDALLSKDSATISEIAAQMSTSTNNAYYYRNRLVNKGLVVSRARGSVELASAYLRDYLLKRDT